MTFSRAPDSPLGRLSLEAQSQIDLVCVRFEAAWKDGTSPRAEEFLASSGFTAEEPLLYELLAIEGDYRRHDPDFCAPDCLRRFPNHATAIQGWFASGELRAGVSRDGQRTGSSGEPPGSDSAGDDASTLALGVQALAEPRNVHDVPSSGRFRLLRPHASGGLGQIWLARDEELGRDVAFKQIKSRFADDALCQARFVREAETTGRLEHPGVVPVYGLGNDRDGRPFYAMRFVGGETLHAAIRRWREGGGQPSGLEFRKLLRHFLDICNVVEFAHSRDVIHRDIKPQNVMLGQFGETMLLDWGLARQLDHKEAAPPTEHEAIDAALTQMGTVLGTIHYMSPEQAAGQIDEVDRASDIFNLGAMLYCILTGHAPYGHDEDVDELEQARLARFAAPRAENPALSPALEAVCLKAMRLAKADRYATARALADDVERWLADEPVTVYRDGWLVSTARWSRRHKARVAAGFVGAVILLVSLAVIIAVQNRAQVRVVEKNKVIERQRDESYTLLQREQISRAVRSANPGEMRDALRRVPAARRGWEWQRLALELELGPRPIASLASHDWGLLDFIWHETTDTLITAGHDGRLLVWHGNDPAPRELTAGSWSQDRLAWRHAMFNFDDEPGDLKIDDCFVRLAWLEPGKKLVGISLRGKVVAWTLPDDHAEAECRELAGHRRPFYAVAVQDGRILCGDDQGGLLSLVSDHDADSVPSQPLSAAAVLDLVALPGGHWAAAQQDGVVSLLDPAGTSVLRQLSIEGPAWDLDVSPDGALLAVACGREQIDCYRLDASFERLDLEKSYQATRDPVTPATAMHAVKFSPDGQWLAAGDNRGRLLVWNRNDTKAAFVSDALPVLSEDRADGLPWPFRRRLASILFSGSGDDCLVAGHDPVVRRWRLRYGRGISELRLGAGPRARFDPVQGHVLWAGTADGSLSLWDSRALRQIAAVPAHAGAVVALDVAATETAAPSLSAKASEPGQQAVAGVAATCGPAGDIRCWTWCGQQIEPIHDIIQHGVKLTCLALSPDGRRIAACDLANHVIVWQLPAGRRLATRELANDTDATAPVRVAFNADGTRLAVCGPGSSFWLLDAATLRVLEKPDVVAGRGGTVLLWHPDENDTLFAGDALGRLVRYPRRGWARFHPPPPDSAVAGIACSPYGDGGRVAAAWRNGEVHIFDPKWAGDLMTLQSSHSSAGPSAAVDLLFDRAGRRLALVHDDGVVEIWETPAEIAAPPHRTIHSWRPKTLATGEHLAGLELRRQAMAIDQSGRLSLLCTALDSRQDMVAPEAEGRKLVFLQEDNRQTRSTILPGRAVPRSLALQWVGSELLATVRRPLPAAGGPRGAFLLLRGRPTEGDQILWTEEDLTPRPNNEGFDVELLSAAGARPVVVHFTHAGWYLLATWHDGAQWQTSRLGREGDGLRHLTAASHDGRTWYSVFVPNGLSGNLQISACLVTDWRSATSGQPADAWLPGRRELCDGTPANCRHGIAVGTDGTPALLYSRSAENPHDKLLLARRTEAGWKSSQVLGFNPSLVSNLVAAGDGQLAFAYADADDRTLCLARGHSDVWESEWVGDLPSLEEMPGEWDEHQSRQLFLIVDGGGQPVIVVRATTSQAGALWSFRAE